MAAAGRAGSSAVIHTPTSSMANKNTSNVLGVQLLEENQRSYVSAGQIAATNKKHHTLGSTEDYPAASQVLPRAPENSNILLLGLAWRTTKNQLSFQLYRSRKLWCTTTASKIAPMVVYLPALDAFGFFMPTDAILSHFLVDGCPPRMAVHSSMYNLVCVIVPHGSVVSIGYWRIQMFYAHWASDPAKWQRFGTSNQSPEWMNRVMTAPREAYFLTAEIEKAEQFRDAGRRCLLRRLADCPATQQAVLGFVAQYDIKTSVLANCLKSFNTEKDLDVAGFLDSEKTRNRISAAPTVVPSTPAPALVSASASVPIVAAPTPKLVRARSPSPAPPQVTPLGPLPNAVCWSPEYLAHYLCMADLPNPEVQLAAQKAAEIAAAIEFADPIPEFVIDALPSLSGVQFGQVQALYEAACTLALRRLSIWPQRLCGLPLLKQGRLAAMPYDEMCFAAEIAQYVLNPDYPIGVDKGLRWWFQRHVLDLGAFQPSTPACWEPVFLFGMCAGLAWVEYQTRHQEGIANRGRLFKNLVACSTKLLEYVVEDDKNSFTNRFRYSWQTSAIQDEAELPAALDRVENLVRDARWIELLAFWFGDCRKLAQHIAAYEIALNMSSVLLAKQSDLRVAFVAREFENTKFGQRVSWNVRQDGPRVFGVPCSLIFQETTWPTRSLFHQTAAYLEDETKSPDERAFLPHELDFDDVYYVLHDEVSPLAAVWTRSLVPGVVGLDEIQIVEETYESDAEQEEEEDFMRPKSAKRGRKVIDDDEDYVPTQGTEGAEIALLECSDGTEVQVSAWMKDLLSLSNVSADEYLEWRAFGVLDAPNGWEEDGDYPASNFESLKDLSRFFDALIQKDPFLPANSEWWNTIAASFQIPVQECKAIALDRTCLNKVAAALRQSNLPDAKRAKPNE